MRLFYAAIFADRQLDTITRLQEELNPILDRGRFISRDNFHITLHFLGERSPEEVEQYSRFLDEAAEGLDPISLKFTGFGTFPRRGEHLIYLKAETGSRGESLDTPAERLKELTGEGDRRRIKPHITLVRRGIISEENLEAMKEIKFDLPPVTIRTLALMESARIRGKLTYIPVHRIDLG